MDDYFFRTPWASDGDCQAIPESATEDGSVSFELGWGEDYEKDMTTDASAKPVERTVMNCILNRITMVLRLYQTQLWPEFITSEMNGGDSFSYPAGVVVRYGDALYVSLVDENTTVPVDDGEKWQQLLYRRATLEDALTGTGVTQVITPSVLKAYTDENFQAKGDYYTKTESDDRFQPKGDYYTKTESDDRFQAKGDYYTKTESDALYVQAVQLGASVYVGKGGYAASGHLIYALDGGETMSWCYARPVQVKINGVWATIDSVD